MLTGGTRQQDQFAVSSLKPITTQPSLRLYLRDSQTLNNIQCRSLAPKLPAVRTVVSLCALAVVSLCALAVVSLCALTVVSLCALAVVSLCALAVVSLCVLTVVSLCALAVV